MNEWYDSSVYCLCWLLVIVGIFYVFVVLMGCSFEFYFNDLDYVMISVLFKVWCEVNVVGKGKKDVEINYIFYVIWCENGGVFFEVLKV